MLSLEFGSSDLSTSIILILNHSVQVIGSCGSECLSIFLTLILTDVSDKTFFFFFKLMTCYDPNHGQGVCVLCACWCQVPWPILTKPMMMMSARARSFAAAKMSWTRVAAFTL